MMEAHDSSSCIIETKVRVVSICVHVHLVLLDFVGKVRRVEDKKTRTLFRFCMTKPACRRQILYAGTVSLPPWHVVEQTGSLRRTTASPVYFYSRQ